MTQAGSGPFGRGGGRVLRMRLVFRGKLGPPFEAFVQARARRLSLPVEMTCSETEAQVLTQGPEAMIGALEMAACVAPANCVVETWACEEVPG